jgi:hypothetical protein
MSSQPMTHRERALAVLHYQPYDRLPIVHFGFWEGLLAKWEREGHITKAERDNGYDAQPEETTLAAKLGFDFNWRTVFSPNSLLDPGFESVVVKEFPDGSRHIRTGVGSIILNKPEAGSIPSEVDHLLKDRASWEEHFKPRLQFNPERVTTAAVPRVNKPYVAFDPEGKAYIQDPAREYPVGLEAGSLYGNIRNMVGIENLCYMQVDDEPLLIEIIETIGELCYQNVKYALENGAKCDFLHFWEDIACKSGPLVNPRFFKTHVGPQYKRITDLARSYGLDICSLDCDGVIDALIPTWIENGVNTMFPIEVGTWNAEIAPWREQYGKELHGVGGMRKYIFATDRARVDAEVERLRKLVDLGGYLPCPDHRISEDAEWDLVKYYCEKMHKAFS